MSKISIRFKGGPGSGYFNHPGRPGEIGGSSDSPQLASIKEFSYDDRNMQSFKIAKNRVGSYWIDKQGVLYKQHKGLHQDVFNAYNDSVEQKDKYVSMKSFIEGTGIIALHVQSYEFAFRIPTKISQAQKDAIFALKLMPRAPRSIKFEVGTNYRARDFDEIFGD